ncbi:unnamed protein product [Plutella xylostella]|uniref:(diamondback moth) hypothetical protein n=1 Tax=Plutella xylostella TaxID=51655 RepID=A0A8S4G644_PLUXY|nr:unnamed protein product [Plutella xylostella]
MTEVQDIGKPSLWEYFKKVGDEDDRLAACFFCEKVYCYKTTIFNLKHHLLKKHSDQMDVNPECLLNVKQRQSTEKITMPKITKPLIWQHFEVISRQDKIAVCNICNKKLSYRTNHCNLKSHLRTMHKDEFERLTIIAMSEALNSYNDDEVDDNDDESESVDADHELHTTDDVDPQSPNALTPAEVWKLFERETGGRARCGICRASVPSTDHALLGHLRARHTKITLKDVQESDNEFETENLASVTDDDQYTEIVYLDELSDGTVKNITKKFNSTPKKYAKKKSQRFSPEEDIQTVKRRKVNKSPERNEDNKAIFLKYLFTLLKDVPKERFMKLQLDMINLVMAARNDNNTSNSEAATVKIRQDGASSSVTADQVTEDFSEIGSVADNDNEDVNNDVNQSGNVTNMTD